MAVAEGDVRSTLMSLFNAFRDSFVVVIRVLGSRASPNVTIPIFKHSIPAGDSIPKPEHIAGSSNLILCNRSISGTSPPTNILSPQPQRGFIRRHSQSFTVGTVAEV
jgi:hypothetical protein